MTAQPHHETQRRRLAAATWADDADKPASDDELIAACAAARAAVRAFDEGARRGDTFRNLCELSFEEQRAFKAVAAYKSATPQGIAEKAMLLDCHFKAFGRRDNGEETFDVALSLAADAMALAKAMIPRARQTAAE